MKLVIQPRELKWKSRQRRILVFNPEFLGKTKETVLTVSNGFTKFNEERYYCQKTPMIIKGVMNAITIPINPKNLSKFEFIDDTSFLSIIK